MTMFNESVKRAMVGTVGALVFGFVCLGAAVGPAQANVVTVAAVAR